MKRRCQGCRAFLRALNPGPMCDPCSLAITESGLANIRRLEEVRQARQRTVERMKQKATATKPTGNLTGLCMCGCGSPTPLATRTVTKKNQLRGKPVNYIPSHHSGPKLDARHGVLNGRAKLNAHLVIRLRREYAAGGVSHRQLAEKYGVREQTARDAIVGHTWAHVIDEEAA